MKTITMPATTEITMCQIPAPGRYRERWVDHDLDEVAGDTERLKNLATDIAARGFDPYYPVLLLDMEDGDYAVINGRHRILAARQAAEVWNARDEMVCVVLTEEEWADLPYLDSLNQAEHHIRQELGL